MKTRNNNTGTRKSKMKNAFLKGGAIIISFILISFTVSAQGFWKQLLTESSLSNVAMMMVGNTGTNSQSASVNPSPASEITEDKTMNRTLQSESDKPLNLESWMTESGYFGETILSVTKDADAKLELETWMINNPHFSSTPVIEPEPDSEMKLEKWMVSDSFWKI